MGAGNGTVSRACRMLRATSPDARSSNAIPTCSFEIDIAEVQAAEGRICLLVGMDWTSRFAVAQLVATADRKTVWKFLQHMLEAIRYQVRTILTDNGIRSQSSLGTATPSTPGRCAST